MAWENGCLDLQQDDLIPLDLTFFVQMGYAGYIFIESVSPFNKISLPEDITEEKTIIRSITYDARMSIYTPCTFTRFKNLDLRPVKY